MTITDERLEKLINDFNHSLAYANEDTDDILDALNELLRLRVEIVEKDALIRRALKMVYRLEKQIAEKDEQIIAWREDAERLANLSTLLISHVEEFHKENGVENPEYQAADDVCLLGHEQTLTRHNALLQKYRKA